MARNLDVAALRSFLAVAEIGGVTRAATQMNLTQSAVSLQIKRLEAAFGQALIRRDGRGVALTTHGERLVDHARRLLAANDETWRQMASPAIAGEISLGAPDDLLHTHVPKVMPAFASACPRVRVQLRSGQTSVLKDEFARGALDVMLATELDPSGETLASAPLAWIGAPGGSAWRRRPLPLGTVAGCGYTRAAIEALNAAAFDWKLEADSIASPAMEASIAADMVVCLLMRGATPPRFEEIAHRGALPELPVFYVNMYVTRGPRARLAEPLAQQLRVAFDAGDRLAAE